MYQIKPKLYLTSTEEIQLEETLNLAGDNRDTLIIRLLRDGGMRPQELLNLCKKDVLSSEQSIHIAGLKGSNDRTLFVEKHNFKRLLYIKKTSTTDRIFPITTRRLGYIWETYRPCKKPLKCLRHTMAVRLVEDGASLDELMGTLGHRSLASAQVYVTHVTNPLVVKKAIQRRFERRNFKRRRNSLKY